MIAHHRMVLSVMLLSFAGQVPPAIARESESSNDRLGIQSTSPGCPKKLRRGSPGYAENRCMPRTTSQLIRTIPG